MTLGLGLLIVKVGLSASTTVASAITDPGVRDACRAQVRVMDRGSER